MNIIATIIEGPHLLFTGANGSKTYGVTVQSALTPEECKARGLRYTWGINHHTLCRADLSTLGLTPEEGASLKDEMNRLLKS